MKKTNDWVRSWFGERGYPFSQKSKLKFKIINNWIFIHNSLDEYDEVELFDLNNMYCEVYDGWKTKDFSWAKNNLLKLIPKKTNEEIENE